jgi:phage/plasmid-associated DNA primase
LAEEPMDYMPIVIDFLFKFPCDLDDDFYEDNLVYALVQCCQMQIERLFHLSSSNKSELICVFLETDMWESYTEEEDDRRTVTCSKIRLHFPFCHVKASLQNTLLRENILRELSIIDAFKLFKTMPIGTWDDIMIKDVVSNPLTMYGSTKIPSQPKLRVLNVWGQITSAMFDPFNQGGEFDEVEDLCTDEFFLPRHHYHVSENLINGNIFLDVENNEDIEDPIEYWWPLFLSIWYWNKPTNPKVNSTLSKGKERLSVYENDEGPSKLLYTSPSEEITVGSSFETDLEGRHMDILKDLLPLLREYRFKEQLFWEDIVQATYHSSKGSSEGYKLVLDFTNRYCPERLKRVEEFYRTCSKTRITVKTIAWYAREDNRGKYNTWHKAWCVKSMEKSLTCYDNDIAKALYRRYWLDFLCVCNGRSYRWYQYKNHKWHDIKKGIELRKRISRGFVKQYEAMRTELSNEIMRSVDETFRSRGEINIKKIGTVIKRLKTNNCKNKIMSEAVEFFENDYFDGWIDDNENLMGLENGIFQICGQECCFRPGKPEDYITKSAIVGYDSSFSYDHPLVRELLEWINQVFPDKELAHHFLKYVASFIKSGNREKFLVIFTGRGDNSKSMICKLFGCLGSYCVRLPVATVMQRNQRSGGAANPEIARSKSAKVAIMQEPEDEDIFKSGTLKDLTGGDPLYARFLNENGGEFKNTFKLILQCNNIPTFANPTESVKNRTKICPRMEKDVDNPPKDHEEQRRQRKFKKDPMFEERLKYLMPGLLWLMKEYYPLYAKEGLPDPPIVKEHTEKYWKENDVYYQYVQDRITHAYNEKGERDPKTALTLSQIYNDFKNFFHENYPSSAVPDRKMVRMNLENTFQQKMHGLGWMGIRFKPMMANLPGVPDGTSFQGPPSQVSKGGGVLGL